MAPTPLPLASTSTKNGNVNICNAKMGALTMARFNSPNARVPSMVRQKFPFLRKLVKGLLMIVVDEPPVVAGEAK